MNVCTIFWTSGQLARTYPGAIAQRDLRLLRSGWWWIVNTSELSALALSRILLHEAAISGELLEHLAKTVPEILPVGNPIFQVVSQRTLQAF